MQLAILVLIAIGILLIYSAVTGRKPQEIVASTLGGKA